MKMRSSVAFTLGLAASTHAAVISTRQTKPYITVLTETASHWSRDYPDQLSTLIKSYGGATPINVTCWTDTTMMDSKGIENDNPTWLGVANATSSLSAYIPEDYIQAGDTDFTSELEECPKITHAAGFVDTQYWIDVVDPVSNITLDWYFPCYDQPSTKANFKKDFDVNYPEIECYKEGGEAVNGNTTWVYELRLKCFLPGGWFEPNEYHGTAGLC